MSPRFITRDGCTLAYEDRGTGIPVLWQHGLGADRHQPAEVFPELPGLRRLTLECRGHGDSELGDPARLSIAQFADDALALLDHLQIHTFIAGGISLGAALSLRLAALASARIRSLILARPAWVLAPAPPTMRPYLLIADLLRTHGAKEGLRLSRAAELLQTVAAVSPDNATSLRSFFTRNDKASTLELLSRLPNDGPGLTAEQLAAIHIPTLIIANEQDYVHPLVYAEELNHLLPQATLRVICSKTIDPALYRAQFRETLATFLVQHPARPWDLA